MNEVVDRITSNDYSYSDLIRLSSAADQHFCRRRRHPSSSSAPGPSTRLSYVNVLFDNWFVSAAVAVEIVVRSARSSSKKLSAEVAVDLLACSGTSNIVIFVVVVFYVGAASSCRSSSTTTRHSTTSSTTSILRRRLRPYPLYTPCAHARRLGTFVCKL